MGDTAEEEYPSGDVRFATSVWRGGTWKELSEWVEHGLSADEQLNFRKGFTVPGLIGPY